MTKWTIHAANFAFNLGAAHAVHLTRSHLGSPMKHLVILGGGTAGTMMANRLRRRLDESWAITVFDRDLAHIYQPGLLFVPFGMYRPEELVRARDRLFIDGITLRTTAIHAIDPAQRQLVLDGGERFRWDLLIVATGTQIAPALTPGLLGDHWGRSASDFYTLEGATQLRRMLDTFQGGRLVVNVAEMPIKCPVAPLEFLFLADAYFTERGIRDRVELVYATPLDAAFTKPVAAHMLGDMLERRGIALEPSFSLQEVDGPGRAIVGYDGRTIAYDLLVSVPLHTGASLLRDAGLGDPMGFVPTDKHTLQSRDFEHVFALGDATDLPTSKAGSVAHFQAEVLTQNILDYIAARPLSERFDGHANCFIETGFGKAMLIDFNYQTEPLPGRFPLPGVGPFTLLEESRVNHWGKLGFRWIYWNKLVTGEDLPMDHRMVMAGKWSNADVR